MKRLQQIRMRISPATRESGFSLLEIIFALAIFAGISLVVMSLRNSVGIMESLVSQKLQSQQDTAQALQILTTDIRSAGPSSIGAYPIDAASTSSFSFYSDIDRDGVFDRVRYFLATSTIKRGIITPVGNPLVYSTSTERITTSIANVVISTSTPIFSYYDPAYTGSEQSLPIPINLSQIRAVKVSVYVGIKAASTKQTLFFTQTMVIRNLKGT